MADDVERSRRLAEWNNLTKEQRDAVWKDIQKRMFTNFFANPQLAQLDCDFSEPTALSDSGKRGEVKRNG